MKSVSSESELRDTQFSFPKRHSRMMQKAAQDGGVFDEHVLTVVRDGEEVSLHVSTEKKEE